MPEIKTLIVTDRAAWRAWLEANQASEKEIWVVFYKKSSGKPRLAYTDAVEEALCFGWIDSIIRRIDDLSYAQKFTPRRDRSKWSALNLSRMHRLIAEGRMTPAGLEKLPPALRDLSALPADPPEKPSQKALIVPDFINQGLDANPRARAFFEKLPPSQRRNIIAWIMSGKKEETRQKHLQEAITLFAEGRPLGMK